MKALFVGLGGVGQRHLRNLRRIDPEARIAAVRHGSRGFEIHDDFQTDETVDIVEKYGIETYADLAAAMAFAPDFAVVANPTALHVPTAAALVERGVPVFLEKPVGTEADDAAALAVLAAARAVPVAVAYQLRRHPCVRKAKEWIDAGRLGRLQSAEARVHAWMPGWHPYEDYRDLYAARRDLGGGVVLTEIHEIDLLSWLLGPARRVCAIGGRLGGMDMDVEDSMSAVLECGDDSHAFPATVSLSFVQRPPTRHLAVYGEKGALTVSIPQDWAELADAETGETERFALKDFVRNDMFIGTLRHFIECLASGEEPETSLRRCLPGHEVALAIRRSLGGGGLVDVVPG